MSFLIATTGKKILQFQDYQYENGLCKSVVTETSLIINGKKSVILWPMIAVGVGAIALIVLSAFVFVYFIKNHHAKSSLPNSESGTDVWSIFFFLWILDRLFLLKQARQLQGIWVKRGKYVYSFRLIQHIRQQLFDRKF